MYIYIHVCGTMYVWIQRHIICSCDGLVAPEAHDPAWVIPLRLFGDGAESYSDLTKNQLQKTSFGFGPKPSCPEESKNSRSYPWSCLLSLVARVQPWTRESCGMAQSSVALLWNTPTPKYIFEKISPRMERIYIVGGNQFQPPRNQIRQRKFHHNFKPKGIPGISPCDVWLPHDSLSDWYFWWV